MHRYTLSNDSSAIIRYYQQVSQSHEDYQDVEMESLDSRFIFFE